MRTSPWLISLAACLLAGCTQPTAPAPPAPTPASPPTAKTPAAKSGRTFVMVPKGVHPYYDPCFEGFKAAAAKHGVTVEFQAPQAFELPQQVTVLENLVSRKVDGIALSAVDDQGLVPVIQKATDAGIKVICFDAPAPSSAALTYIGTANEAAGQAGAEALAKELGSEGEVAVLQGGLAAANLNERYHGFETWLKANAPRITLVAREDIQGKIDVAVNKTEALLEAHPKVKAIFSVSAEGVPGAAAALAQGNKSGIVLAGFDDQPDTLEGIRKGTVRFCIAQRTYKMGWMAVEKLLDALDGKPLEKQYDTGVVLVTKANVDSYMQDMKKGLE